MRKYCIFGCCTHWPHRRVTVLKWLNTNSGSYGSVVAAAWLNTRSICKLCVISAVAPHSSLTLQVQSIRAESGRRNKHASCSYFGLYGDTPLNHRSMCVIVGSALRLGIKFTYFSKEEQRFNWTESLWTCIWKNNRSPYQSGQREITYPAKLISDNFWSGNRGHDPKHGIWNNPMCLV